MLQDSVKLMETWSSVMTDRKRKIVNKQIIGKWFRKTVAFLLLYAVLLSGCSPMDVLEAQAQKQSEEISVNYEGSPYVEVNGNQPDFSEEEMTTDSYEKYSDLDSLGRCGVAEACIGEDLMPVEERKSIGSVKPSGWQLVKYDQVDGKYLYNRCHLIGYQLTAENANEKNLITGTRYLNVEGMLPFENMVADYIKETGNHVMYRVTPVFEGDNLVASGVKMEAESVEDQGRGICYNVFVYNVQPGIDIDYANGNSREEDQEKQQTVSEESVRYILNTNTKKFHRPSCHSVQDMKGKNRKEYTGRREDLIQEGYEACGSCKP